MNSLDYYKSQISIIEFIKYKKDLDFELQKKGKQVLAFRVSKNNPEIKLDQIAIYRLEKKSTNSLYEVFYYKDNINSKTPGSIIDFVNTFVLGNKDQIDFKQIVGVLKDYMSSKEFVNIENSYELNLSNKPSEAIKETKAKDYFTLPSSNVFSYLSQRGINTKTYLNNLFIGTYGSFNNPRNSSQHDLPAFALKHKNKLHTLQWINYKNGRVVKLDDNYKFFLKDIKRSGSLYSTNFMPSHKSNSTNTSIIIESPEKAMAHYQLFEDDFLSSGVRPQYNSSCGNITKNDLLQVVEFNSEKNIKNYVLAFDNDQAGKLYTLNSILIIDDQLKSTFQYRNKELFLKFSPENQTYLNNHSIEYNLLNSEFKIKTPIDLIIKKIVPKNIIIHTSISKDFLDDLNSSKKLPFKFKFSDNNQVNKQISR